MSIGTRAAHADDLKSYLLNVNIKININIKIGFHEITKLP
jgi:hypothetical protein